MRKFVVSTDCCGVFGMPHMWETAWIDAVKDPGFLGFELLAWRWSKMLVKRAQKMNLTLYGTHGKVNESVKTSNLFDKVVMTGIESLMAEHRTLLTLRDNFEYILFHENAVTENDISLLKSTPNLPLIMIENIISRGAYEKACELVIRLNSEGIKTGLMFDLAHFLREPDFDAPQIVNFSKLTTAISKLKDQSFPVSFHIPIGTYLNDSIPIETLTADKISQLADSINEANPIFVVLENQQRRAYSLYEPPWAFENLVRRNKKVFNILREHNII